MSDQASYAMAAHGIPWWLSVMIGAGLFVMIFGGVVGIFRPEKLLPGFPPPKILAAYAHYFAIRNLTLAIALIMLSALHAGRTLGMLAAIVAITQVFDAVVDFSQGGWRRLFGLLVLVFAVLLFVAAARLTGYPFWERAAWLD